MRKLRPSGYGLPHGITALAVLFLSLSILHELPAQCQLSCHGKLNVSLGDHCQVEITPIMLLTSGPRDCPNARYRVDVLDHYMKKIPTSPFVTGDYMRKELIGMVFDSNSRNSCWTKLFIEDKFGPQVECHMDTVYCNDSIAYTTPYFYDNCDPNPTIALLTEYAEPIDCDPYLIKKLTRIWQATDNYGNKGKICTSMFWLKRIPIDSVWYPKHYVKANDCNLECNGVYELDGNGHPHPNVTGTPHFLGDPLWPSFLYFCNLSTTYEDQVIVDLPCKKKILRLWKVIEWWCGTANIRTHAQTIEILDTKPPVLHCPYDFTVTTAGGYTCEAVVWMPAITVHDSCQDTVHVDIHYPGGVLRDHNGGDIRLKPGIHRVVYVAHDGCYNEDSCAVYVTVVDKTPPVAVCQQNTVVSMTRDDIVHVYAESFDDGSYDDCHIDSFLVRRMDNGAPCQFADTIFRPYVEFCCADAGKEVMVIFRVKDKAGNVNDCMVNVEIQDKTPPIVDCPHDVRIPCGKHNDTIDLKRYGKPDYYDNCVVELSEYVDSFLNQCGLGYLERVFVVKDNMGRTDTCRQHIEIYDTDPFDENDIIWPYDYHVYSCGGDLDPKNLPDTFGYPIILENDCSLIGISYEDHQFNYVQDTAVCFKILRKWKVIDWCQCYYDARAGQQVCPTWYHEQIIKVSNRLAPKIKDDCLTLNLCLSDQECLKERVTLRHEAEDDCTPDHLLYSSFKIDLYNNGLFDSTYATLGNVITFDGELPVGEHRFLWIFDDQCGNREICTQFVNIRNCKPPTAYCLIGINVNLMPVDTNRDGTPDWGMIDVWANDVDKGSYQFCGNPVTVSFSRDTFDRYRRYDCDSLGQHKVSMWVTDQLTGLQDFCITTITIQDNNHVCPGGGTITAGIAGSLRTPFDQQVNDVTIRLDGPQGVVYKDFNGQYSFSNLLVGADYIVSAVVDKNYMEGISTLDIVKIQRHILGLEPFVMPWHFIAADVTGDHRVTSADVANIRKLILGVDGKYKNNFSWTLMDANYQFPNPNDPWMESLPMQYRISSLAGPMPYLDFVGVKVGDVSQTTWAGFGKMEVRSKATCEWELGESGVDQRIPVYATQDMILRGMQFTLKYDPSKCNVTRVVPGSVPIQESNLGWGFAQKGYVLVSWNAQEEVHVQAGDLLFYIETDTPSDAGSFDINSEVLNAEAYNAADEILPIQLRANGVRTDAGVVFGEPLPNPFAQATILKLYLKQATEVRYSISDLNGKLIYRQKESYQGGQNVLTIKKDVLTGPGVYLLKVEAGEYTKSMKLVLIAN